MVFPEQSGGGKSERKGGKKGKASFSRLDLLRGTVAWVSPRKTVRHNNRGDVEKTGKGEETDFFRELGAPST